MSEGDGRSQAWLAVVAGEHEGARYPLQGDDLTLGRGTDNDLVLPDIAVSRKHFRLVATATGWHFRDLGSGNGTRLNGRTSDEGDLADGDQIEVGNSVLEYLALDRPPGKVRSRPKTKGAALTPPPADDMDSPMERRKTQAADLRVYKRPRSSARVALWAAVMASVVVTLGVLTASWLTYRDTTGGAAHSAGLAHYRRGAAAFQQRDWDGALAAYRKAAAADPSLADADRAVREIRAYRDVYRRGMALGGRGHALEATSLLSGIPRGAAFHAEAQTALKMLLGGVAAASQDMPNAAKPKSVRPRPRSAARGAASKSAARPAPGPTRTEVGSLGVGVDNAMAKYRAGLFEEAARILHAAAAHGDSRAGKMASDVRSFARAQAAGAAALDAGKIAGAIGHLDAALKLDEGLGRGYRSMVARQLAEALARRAEDQLEDGRLQESAKTAVRARSLVRDHRAAQAVLNKLVVKARELTLQAMQLRNPQPQAAIAKLKTALRITPRKSPEHARASDLLMKIEDSL